MKTVKSPKPPKLLQISKENGAKTEISNDDEVWATIQRIAAHYDISPAKVLKQLYTFGSVQTLFAIYNLI